MWTCPKCGRTFKRMDQDHYCGKAPVSIDEYISRQPMEAQPYLKIVDAAIHEALPDAERRIAWSMPNYREGRNILQFACAKKSVNLYVGTGAVECFADRLSGYKTNKGTIYIPYEMPMPVELISDIARWCGESAHRD